MPGEDDFVDPPLGGKTMAQHVAAAKQPDPKAEAIWIMAQGMAKARAAGMDDNEILEALYHQTAQDEERNAIVSRAAPAWAWAVIDNAITARLIHDEGGKDDTLAVAIAAMEQATNSDGEEPITEADTRRIVRGEG